jgi:glycosyltransferase involved in cell wall biosynthesis
MMRSAHPFSEARRRVPHSARPESVGSHWLRHTTPGGSYRTESTAYDVTTQIRTSVLVVALNDAPFIEDCIESLLVQSVLADEIIVCDAGSCDGTVERLRRYGDRITLLESVRPPNVTLEHYRASLLETAFRRSTGQLIFLLNGHDRFKRDKIESYVAVFTTNLDAAVIQAPMDKIDEHGRVIAAHVESWKHVVEHLKEIHRRQDVDFYYPVSALAFSRRYWKALMPRTEADPDTASIEARLCIVAPHFGRVITLPAKLTEWRRRSRRPHSARYSRSFHFQQTLFRARVFNEFSQRHGLPSISPWRNRRFYLQLLRFTLPDIAYRLFHAKRHQRDAVKREQ